MGKLYHNPYKFANAFARRLSNFLLLGGAGAALKP